VQAQDLAQVADKLYGLPPSAFIQARDERATQARAAGDRDLADAIRKLRRPTVSAWLVNRLAREAPGQVEELLELGESLREAQQALAGDRLRELSTQRRRLVTGLVQEARRLAEQSGQALGASAEREVQETLEATLADPAVGEAVRSGRLTTALSYAGLGASVDVHGAVAVWPEPVEQPRRRAAPAGGREREARHPAAAKRRTREAGTAPRDREEAKAAERARREAEAAERARQEAEAAERNRQDAADDAREAQATLDEADREVASARDKHEDLQRRIDELERQLAEIQTESAERLRALRHAQRNRDIAARALDGALRRLARAEAKASQQP
jgi:hypothetical protein